jgi:putative thioredoxin
MTHASPHVIEVGAADFQAEVVERSHQVPVLVDFRAAWCGPCRVLGPVLERLADEGGGRFVLAKVDTEAHPTLGARFAVRGIPAVKLVIDGRVVDEFVGALPEAQVRQFLDRNVPSETDRLVGEARARLGEGDREGATALLEQVVALEPSHAAAHLELGRIALARGDVEALERHIAAIGRAADEWDAAQHLRAAGQFASACAAAGGEQAVRARLAAEPGDLDALLALGHCLATSGDHRGALEALLSAVERDRHHRDDAARKAMLTIFGLLGSRSDLASEYRRKLQILL